MDGGSTWLCEDIVRCTCLKCNFIVSVVRQFHVEDGIRKLLAPDYSSPAAALLAIKKYLSTLKHFALPGNKEDAWWHEVDASLGHGYSVFQYEGPALYEEGLSTKCSASDYNHKYYLGKTGNSGFTFWDHGPGGKNPPGDLAWWDVCGHKVEGQWLVLKRSYTLVPERLGALFNTLNTASRYDNFGLHIKLAEEAWGCLSNVGLAMDDHDIDERMLNCLFNKNMPTTANRSAWNVLMGRALYIDSRGKMYKILHWQDVENLLDVMIDETTGVDWGETADITSLEARMFQILENKEISVPDDEEPKKIKNPADLNLDATATDKLQYYDPGLFPIEFGENPEDIFNMEE